MTTSTKASKVTLTADQRMEIVTRVQNGETKAGLAREFGISARTIGRIVDASKVEELILPPVAPEVSAEIDKNIKLELARIDFERQFHAKGESQLVRRTAKRVVVADYSAKREREAQIAKRKAAKAAKPNKKHFKKPAKIGTFGEALKKAGV
ncbi:MAG: hypothetical protein ACRC3J_05495 [Culicoidibacterales bacterium]